MYVHNIVGAYSEGRQLCYNVAGRTGLDCNDKDVELWQQVFLAGGKELEQIQQTFMYIHIVSLDRGRQEQGGGECGSPTHSSFQL